MGKNLEERVIAAIYALTWTAITDAQYDSEPGPVRRRSSPPV